MLRKKDSKKFKKVLDFRCKSAIIVSVRKRYRTELRGITK